MLLSVRSSACHRTALLVLLVVCLAPESPSLAPPTASVSAVAAGSLPPAGGARARARSRSWRLLALRGAGQDGDEGAEVGFGTYDLNAADPNLPPGQTGIEAPWLKDREESDEERELVAGMRQKLVLGEDKWYDDAFAAVPRNKQGAYDMHADEGQESYYNSRQDLLEDDSNPEGYMGAVDEEGMQQLYPALKQTYAYYARAMPLEERPAAHRFQVGDLVTLSPEYRDRDLGNYSSAAAQGMEGVPEWNLKGLHNDAELGPLRPDDVGVVVEDDSSLKPYLVKALDSKCYKEGYPGRWVDQWWYVAEALVRWQPAPTVDFAPDAEVRVPADFATVKLALKNMTEGQSLYVTGGEYHMVEAVEFGDHPEGWYPAHIRSRLRTLRLRGGPGARSWGRNIFGRWAQVLLHARAPPRTRDHARDILAACWLDLVALTPMAMLLALVAVLLRKSCSTSLARRRLLRDFARRAAAPLCSVPWLRRKTEEKTMTVVCCAGANDGANTEGGMRAGGGGGHDSAPQDAQQLQGHRRGPWRTLDVWCKFGALCGRYAVLCTCNVSLARVWAGMGRALSCA